MAEIINQLGRRYLGDSACLPRALAGIRMLRRRGYPVELQIGIRKTDTNNVIAHAWVVLEQKK